MKSTVRKVMWVGRATVFLVGLAVIVGVTVGLGSAAVAQAQNQPGQPGVFRLATTNTAEAVSGLVGSVAQDAMLLVDNNGGGPALDLQVEPGQAPMKVDSPGKVDNLNADTVDGKSGTDFYAQGSKVADSDKLDGFDGSQFQQSVAQSGQVLSGQIAARYVANSFATIAGDSYPVPLPANTASPTLEFVPTGVTANCPGIGKAAPGVLCIYAYNDANIGTVSFSGGSVSEDERRYGFAIDAFPRERQFNGYLLANWAYKVP